MKSAYSKTLIILVFGFLSIWPAVKANEEGISLDYLAPLDSSFLIDLNTTIVEPEQNKVETISVGENTIDLEIHEIPFVRDSVDSEEEVRAEDLPPNPGLIDSNGIISGNVGKECVDGDVEVKVKAGDNGIEETFKLEEYQSLSQCQFEEPVYLPENIQRTTAIYDWSCSGVCPEFVKLNDEIIPVKDLLKKYYQGNFEAGLKLCSLLNYDPKALKNCLIANFDTLLITEDVPVPSSIPQGCDPTNRENPLCSQDTCPGNQICTFVPFTSRTFGYCECRPPCESAAPSCGFGACPPLANGQRQICRYGTNLMNETTCHCEEDYSCAGINSEGQAFQCSGSCPVGQSCIGGFNPAGVPICNCSTPGCGYETDGNYLLANDRNSLTNKWQVWNNTCKRADNVVIYSATKQAEVGVIQTPSTLSITIPVAGGREQRFTKDIATDIVTRNIVPNNETALRDLSRNVFADYDNRQGRRESGTFPYEFSFSSGGRLIARFRPYYHATFLSEFTSGIGYYSQARDRYSINTAFHNLNRDWEIFRSRFYRLDPDINNGGFPSPQNPIKSPWNTNPSLDLSNTKPNNFVRYAILLEGNGNLDRERNLNVEQYAFHNDIEFMKYILINLYNFDRDKIYYLNQGNINDFRQTFATLAQNAAQAKSANSSTKVQVVIYYAAHGRATTIEDGINSSLQNREGAKRFDMRFAGGILTEDILKRWTRELFFTPLENNTFNSVDQLFFIPEACNSGSSAI